MLISHKHKLITIDIPKTGTRTLRDTLRPTGTINLIGKPASSDPMSFYQHTTIRSAKKKFAKWHLEDPSNWDIGDYYTMVRIRNPWRRYVSAFLWCMRMIQFYFTELQKPLTHSDRQSLSFRQGAQLSARLSRCGSEHEFLRSLIRAWPSQDFYIFDGDKPYPYDLICKLETLEIIGFPQFCKDVGIQPAPDLSWSNKSDYTKDYKQYLNQELIDYISKREKWVIDHAGYQLT